MGRRRLKGTGIILSAGAVFVFPIVGAGSASASPVPNTVYVSAHGSCGNVTFHSIHAALAAVATHGTVVVCAGTYNEDVVVSKPVSLISHGATLNPSVPVLQTNSPVYGQAGNNGITVAATDVLVEGFSVTGATGDGIFSFGNHSTIIGNASNKNASTGIDLNGSSYSLVLFNVTDNNQGGGVTLANDAGAMFPGATASHDVVGHNVAKDNPLGCGVILADHLGTTVAGAKGIFDNLIIDNVLDHNGTGGGTEGAGSGVVLASPVPGGAVFDNQVVGNEAARNGLAGVTVHSHIPGQNFVGNVITGNDLGTGNVEGDFADPATTGVYIGSASPLAVTVAHNTIHDNRIGVFSAGKVTVTGVATNTFAQVKFPFAGTPVYSG